MMVREVKNLKFCGPVDLIFCALYTVISLYFLLGFICISIYVYLIWLCLSTYQPIYLSVLSLYYGEKQFVLILSPRINYTDKHKSSNIGFFNPLGDGWWQRRAGPRALTSVLLIAGTKVSFDSTTLVRKS